MSIGKTVTLAMLTVSMVGVTGCAQTANPIADVSVNPRPVQEGAPCDKDGVLGVSGQGKNFMCEKSWFGLGDGTWQPYDPNSGR